VNAGPRRTEAHIGSRQTKAWILDQLNNPPSHKPDSIMPSFAPLREPEKDELAEYLEGLK
jgi:cbb3-type cytochrome oxidase cytochrome c subunit